jgi:signal peptidase II
MDGADGTGRLISAKVIWGPFSALGVGVGALTFVFDQATKFWVLSALNLHEAGSIAVTSFFSLSMAWNEGISYSLFATHRQGVLIALSLVICAVLWRWMAKAERPLSAVALGMIIGGALGNALDRAFHGAVADFLHFYWGAWSWYIFNVADVAIVAGVALLIYESFTSGPARERAAAPDNPARARDGRRI